MKTKTTNKKDLKPKWFLIDVKSKTLGRVSTKIATLLTGKNKSIYQPNLDCGDFVIVVNASMIKVTGNKMSDKSYYRHSGYIGHLKKLTFEEMLKRKPVEIIRSSVKGMLPKNKLGRQQLKKLKIYAGEKHRHKAQQPELIEV